MFAWLTGFARVFELRVFEYRVFDIRVSSEAFGRILRDPYRVLRKDPRRAEPPINLHWDHAPGSGAGWCLFVFSSSMVLLTPNVGSNFLYANYFMAARYSRSTGQTAAAAWAFA
jgi:hypothetical protein